MLCVYLVRFPCSLCSAPNFGMYGNPASISSRGEKKKKRGPAQVPARVTRTMQVFFAAAKPGGRLPGDERTALANGAKQVRALWELSAARRQTEESAHTPSSPPAASKGAPNRSRYIDYASPALVVVDAAPGRSSQCGK